MKYVVKLYEVDAFQFLGEDEGMPSWVSVKGTKLPPKEREAEFYDKYTSDYPRASYGDWILTNGEERWVLKDRIFKNTYDPISKLESQSDFESKQAAPVLEGHTLLALGFR